MFAGCICETGGTDEPVKLGELFEVSKTDEAGRNDDATD